MEDQRAMQRKAVKSAIIGAIMAYCESMDDIRVDVRGNSVEVEVSKRTETVYNGEKSGEINGQSFTIGDDGAMEFEGDFTC